jgi:hypothetical protein
VCELCQRIFKLWPYKVQRNHRVALVRAVKILSAKGYPLATMTSARWGSELMIYWTDSRRSREVPRNLAGRFQRGLIQVLGDSTRS